MESFFDVLPLLLALVLPFGGFFLAEPGPLLPRFPLLRCVVVLPVPEAALLALAEATALLLPLGGVEVTELVTAGELLW